MIRFWWRLIEVPLFEQGRYQKVVDWVHEYANACLQDSELEGARIHSVTLAPRHPAGVAECNEWLLSVAYERIEAGVEG